MDILIQLLLFDNFINIFDHIIKRYEDVDLYRSDTDFLDTLNFVFEIPQDEESLKKLDINIIYIMKEHPENIHCDNDYHLIHIFFMCGRLEPFKYYLNNFLFDTECDISDTLGMFKELSLSHPNKCHKEMIKTFNEVCKLREDK